MTNPATETRHSAGGSKPQEPAITTPGATPSAALRTLLTSSQTLATQLNASTSHLQASGDPLPHPALESYLTALNTLEQPNRPVIFAWLLLRAAYSATRASQLFDELDVRTALAQAFPDFDLRGEQAWRASAQVRLLLEGDLDPLPRTLCSDRFWSSQDARWLLAIDSTGHYVNKEAFATLLPLLAFPTHAATKPINTALETSGYRITDFRHTLSAVGESLTTN